MSTPLTDAEIAELRRIQSNAVSSVPHEGDEVARLALTRAQAAYFLAMAKAIPRALDELEARRKLTDDAVTSIKLAVTEGAAPEHFHEWLLNLARNLRPLGF